MPALGREVVPVDGRGVEQECPARSTVRWMNTHPEVASRSPEAMIGGRSVSPGMSGAVNVDRKRMDVAGPGGRRTGAMTGADGSVSGVMSVRV
jgi:hypothetical protein